MITTSANTCPLPRRTDSRSRRLTPEGAFTLMEVMIAMAIFFMAIFAILSLVSTNIRNAKLLQQSQVDPEMVLGELSLTNKFYEGSESGNFGDIYPDYEWTRQITQVASNGLFQVDVAVYRRHGGAANESHISVLFYRPDSPQGMSFGGLGSTPTLGNPR